jgi:GrpB-like predicted nucleotidyltransferase (UPF0157 family)
MSHVSSEECAHVEPVIVADYNPAWPAQFRSLRGRIAGGLRLMASSVEHVGSTAVHGLAARPVIDIDVLLATDAILSAAIERLTMLGYVHHGDLGMPGREEFRAPAGSIAHHLHVCSPNSQEFRRHVALRNFLRSHPIEVQQYGDLKRALAERFAGDGEAYQAGKLEHVEELTKRALAMRRGGLSKRRVAAGRLEKAGVTRRTGTFLHDSSRAKDFTRT